MRRFHLDRLVDVSGVSGTGIIADGVLCPDGQVVLSWRGRFHTLEICPTLEAVLEIHGHHGATKLEWLDKED